jgi:hypothetical protein
MSSAAAMNKAASMIETMKRRIGSVKEKAEEMTGVVLQTVEVGGTAFAMSYANERFGKTVVGLGGELQVAGMPVDLGAAVALKGLAFFGAMGKNSHHAQSVGDGLLACYATRIGGKLGRNAKIASPPKTTAGAFGPGGGYNQAAYEMAGTNGGYG